MEKLRRIEPLKHFPMYKIPKTYIGQVPDIRWVNPLDLYVDETYQRKITRRGLRLIEHITLNFSWSSLKPPIVVEATPATAGTLPILHCIDGQHTAIGAATRKVQAIPVIIIHAETIAARANAFVGHNSDRVRMDPIDIYKARLAANDPDAMDIRNVCERAGVRIRQVQVSQGRILKGDCQSVNVIGAMIKRRSPLRARMVLEALVKAGRGPIYRPEIDAVDMLMHVKRPKLTVDQAADVIAAVGSDGFMRARIKATAEKRPHKALLLDAYLEGLDAAHGELVGV